MLLQSLGFIHRLILPLALDGNVKLVIRLSVSMGRYLPFDLNYIYFCFFLLLFKSRKASVLLDKSVIRHLKEEKIPFPLASLTIFIITRRKEKPHDQRHVNLTEGLKWSAYFRTLQRHGLCGLFLCWGCCIFI